MATIIQINRVNTNRSGAADDVYARLQARTTGADLNIDARHLSIGTGLSVNAATGALDAEATTLNLSDVESFATESARNAHTTTEWHEGDIAIVTTGESRTGPGTMQFPTTLQFANRQDIGATSNTERNRLALWLTGDANTDTAAAQAGPFTVPSEVTGFIGTDEANPLGTITIPAGTRISYNNAFLLIFDADNQKITISTGPTAAGQTATFTGANVPGGETIPGNPNTYVYTGTDQTVAGATTDDDWTALRTPTASNLDASSIASGVFDIDRIPTSIARTTQLRTLTFAQSGNLVSGNSNLTENASDQVTAINISAFSGLTEFPEEVGMFVNGLKVADNEITANAGRTSITFSTPIEFPTTGNLSLTFELMYLS